MKDVIETALAQLSKQVTDLLAERDALRLAISEQRDLQLDETAVSATLHDALTNKQGWREKARKVLGLSQMIACGMCGKLFSSGGKRRNFCNEECRMLAYKTNRSKL